MRKSKAGRNSTPTQNSPAWPDTPRPRLPDFDKLINMEVRAPALVAALAASAAAGAVLATVLQRRSRQEGADQSGLQDTATRAKREGDKSDTDDTTSAAASEDGAASGGGRPPRAPRRHHPRTTGDKRTLRRHKTAQDLRHEEKQAGADAVDALEGRKLPIIIGVGGASGSGKSTISEAVAAKLKRVSIQTISCDSYYKTKPARIPAPDYNFDEPNAIEFELLAQHLRMIKSGESVEVPQYDFTVHSRTDKVQHVDGRHADVIIVDGIFALCREEVRSACDLLLFTVEDADVCLSRRIRRDIAERGRTVESVLNQYAKWVKPAFGKYIQPSMAFADLIIPRGRDNIHAIDLLTRDLAHTVAGIKAAEATALEEIEEWDGTLQEDSGVGVGMA